MRRFLSMIFIFFIFYLGLQMVFKFAITGSNNKYKIKGDQEYTINELLTVNKKEEHDNYFITVSDGTHTFEYQIYEDLNNTERIIKDIKSYSDGTYSCILPIFKNGKNIVDVTCLSNGVQYFYHSIKGSDSSLDSFVSNLDSSLYQAETFEDHGAPNTELKKVTFYLDNTPEGHAIAFQNYRGFYLLNPKITKTAFTSKLFKSDVYNMVIRARVGKYYVVADYDEKYEFQQFRLVDMTTLKDDTLEFNHPVSFDTYVQGVVGNSMYFFDRNNKTQYELNVKTRAVVETGNESSKIQYYNNGKWEERSAYDAYNKNLYFVMNDGSSEFPGYAKVDKIGNELSGFYYLYEQVSNGYRVYRVNVQSDTKIKTYLCTIPTINTVRYVDDYLYYINGDTVQYYQQGKAIRKLYQNSEMGFNSTLSFDVY